MGLKQLGRKKLILLAADLPYNPLERLRSILTYDTGQAGWYWAGWQQIGCNPPGVENIARYPTLEYEIILNIILRLPLLLPDGALDKALIYLKQVE